MSKQNSNRFYDSPTVRRAWITKLMRDYHMVIDGVLLIVIAVFVNLATDCKVWAWVTLAILAPAYVVMLYFRAKTDDFGYVLRRSTWRRVVVGGAREEWVCDINPAFRLSVVVEDFDESYDAPWLKRVYFAQSGPGRVSVIRAAKSGELIEDFRHVVFGGGKYRMPFYNTEYPSGGEPLRYYDTMSDAWYVGNIVYRDDLTDVARSNLATSARKAGIELR